MIKKQKVKFDNKTFILKAQSYRAMFLFEELSDKSAASISTFYDQITYIFCLLKTSNDDFNYGLEEFIDILENDGDNNLVQEFTKLNQLEKK